MSDSVVLTSGRRTPGEGECAQRGEGVALVHGGVKDNNGRHGVLLLMFKGAVTKQPFIRNLRL